ncbi:hydroxymethylglutaryl-CoA synthase [Gardnerella vaginalis]|uniref:hydroxymethylglutaryl-CoA synthase n=1 Tax=Gardnerella vaginalis TaxID=2702 RepID=UPI000C7A0D2D|nr:hydroxymethylglutaryl-CoA synthase [Gardnerella vaginalis]PKZ57485.1 hydroxymethylglutaryl-CoA synthase [Gardnerella vaginalis]PKZ74508.1 hydroxymethylglutaryl-CoA synthase [Gardnerella vaginalis]
MSNTSKNTPKVGIDRITFATPNCYLSMRDLAIERGIDPNKFTIGIGQSQQAVPPNHQDIVTLGAQSALPLMQYIDSNRLKMVIVGTESGVDASKSSALYIHKLLNLSSWVRCVEVKEACYGGTAALMMARDYVLTHPGAQVLVIAADIARYGVGTPGEVTQGAGAVAMLVSENPHVLQINDDSVVKSAEIQDFWRPVYQSTALARGKFSTEQYIRMFCDVWQRYSAENACNFNDFEAICFHLPYTKMGLKALRAGLEEKSSAPITSDTRERLLARYQDSTQYSRRIGNIYTGSLYLGLISLLDFDYFKNFDDSAVDGDSEVSCDLSSATHTNESPTCLSPLLPGQKIGLFSYGSGAVAEFFSATLVPDWRSALFSNQHLKSLNNRTQLSVSQYEEMFNSAAPYSPQDFISSQKNRSGARFVLDSITSQERNYRSI